MNNDDDRVALGLRVAIGAAALGAAAIHFAMVPSHAQDWLALGIGFAVTAWAQATLGIAASVRPRAWTLGAVSLVHAAAIAMWAWSRTTGFPFGPDAGTAESVTSVDITAVALQTAGIAAAALAWASTRRETSAAPGAWLRPVSMVAAVVVGAGSLVGSSAVLASPDAVHSHGDDHGEEHDDGHGHDDTQLASGDHGDHGEGHEHEAEIDPVLGLDVSSATDSEVERAREMVREMEAAMAGYETTADVEAAGYRSIGDSVTGYEHFINIDYIADDDPMEAERVESIVFEVDPDGTKRLVSGMYILPFGQTMDDVPDLGTGSLTEWHDHQDLCWEGARVVGVLDGEGNCPRGEFMATPPMLHVWVVDHECGRFAGIEGSHGDGCGHDHGDDHGSGEPQMDPVLGLDVSSATDSEVERAREMVEEMEAAMAGYETTADVEAAGYISIGDSVTGYEHFINIGHIADDGPMEAERVESIVFEVDPDGTKRLVSGMYILPFGQTMDDVPDLGTGSLTEWHDHQDLCWEGARVVGVLDGEGNCPRGEFRPTPPMLHVWVVDHECGRFAGIEGSHGDGCGHDH